MRAHAGARSPGWRVAGCGRSPTTTRRPRGVVDADAGRVRLATVGTDLGPPDPPVELDG
ncbi:hypothetical protein GHK86_01925 [Acidimicrobiaceae bacterium USS-CC1]|uniref:Uncharacterized protein n=1 Tax=Acidiferrimicrobium australe TaxID=2664430 RepID=A0ABW9QPW1_9ACTN|nr:hypothetical protein [Acidiferrimicrobium australe]